MNRYFVEAYTDGPATRWNVIDRSTRTRQEAEQYAQDRQARSATIPPFKPHQNCKCLMCLAESAR